MARGRLAAIAFAVITAVVLGSTSAAAPIELDAMSCHVDFQAPAANLACSVAVPGANVSLSGELTVIERHAAATRFAYDAAGRLVRTESADGSHSYSFGADGRLLARVDSSGQTIAYAYDELGRVVSAGGVSLAYSGDALAQLVTPDGVAISFAYDASGNLVSARESGARAVFSYGRHRLLDQATTDEGSVTYEYDRQGEPTGRQTPAATSFDYDANGRLVRSVDSTDGETLYAYDRDGSLQSRTSAAGTASLAYGAGGRVVTAIAPDGSRTGLAYDDLGRVVEVAPDAGDEVIVSFEQGDIRRPVVIGFLWSDGDSVDVDAHGRLQGCSRCP